jgi:hypothetical protein
MDRKFIIDKEINLNDSIFLVRKISIFVKRMKNCQKRQREWRKGRLKEKRNSEFYWQLTKRKK